MVDLINLFARMYDKHTELVNTIPPADLVSVYYAPFKRLLGDYPSLEYVKIKQMSAEYTRMIDQWNVSRFGPCVGLFIPLMSLLL